LAALGYVGAAGRGTPAGPESARADPKQMIGVFNRLRDANGAVQAGRFAETETIASEVLRRDPRNAFATIVLAHAEIRPGTSSSVQPQNSNGRWSWTRRRMT
jgi:hypothetical protein